MSRFESRSVTKFPCRCQIQGCRWNSVYFRNAQEVSQLLLKLALKSLEF